ncbi:hypothetical protein C1H46_011250 [Malus baccata]|uniref:Uncharacterized protein n=1 Tax=Malus baccata TaxID=106549 RepID=A0A540MWE8_MALBA|nr:hypothetical protein C1H46_011250 [Malus baccata]
MASTLNNLGILSLQHTPLFSSEISLYYLTLYLIFISSRKDFPLSLRSNNALKYSSTATLVYAAGVWSVIKLEAGPISAPNLGE